MTENETDYNTPIFNRLARERGYDILLSDKPSIPFLRGPVKVLGADVRGNAGECVEMPTANFTMTTITPEFMIENNVDLQEVSQELVAKFHRDYPEVTGPIELTRKDEFDGSVVLIVSEKKDCDNVVAVDPSKAVLESWFEKVAVPDSVPKVDLLEFYSDVTDDFLIEHPNAVITGMVPKFNSDGSAVMAIEAVEPVSPIAHEDLVKVQNGEMTVEELRKKIKIAVGIGSFNGERTESDHIGEDSADALYMKRPPIWGTNEE